MKRTLLGVMVGLSIIGILLHRVNLQQFGEVLWGVRFDLLVVSLGLKVVVMWVKSFRWAIAIRGVTARPVRRAFSASMIGFAGNMLLPARLGEMARISVIDKHNQVGRSLALTTVGIIQLFDLLFLVVYFLVISIWATSQFTAHRLTAGLFGGAVLLTLATLMLLQQRFRSLGVLLFPIRRKLPGTLDQYITRHTDLFIKGLSILNKGNVIACVTLLTFIIWGLETVVTYLMLQAVYIKANLLMAAILVVVQNLSFAFPITPGNLGVFQALSVFLLGTFGVTQESALAYGIAYQIFTFLLIVGLGMIFFYFEKMNLNLLGRTPREGMSGK